MVAEMGRLLGGWQKALRKDKDQATSVSGQDDAGQRPADGEPSQSET
jgi:hypothetical protein